MISENPYFNLEDKLKNYKKFTDYEPTKFQDRIVEMPWTFVLDKVGVDPKTGKDIVNLKFYEGEVIEEGTDLSEMNLGNLDVGIAILYEWRKNIDTTLLQLALKTDGLEMTTLNGMVANAFAATFDNLEGIKINKGYYDKSKGEVWS
ncbi:hypothetical protein K8P03_10850 [Anaerococcus murdochii]|uniref:XkdN-like protein n=1 Tax=Anaerococcus murdochii TaxID=411577 RepID=A0ABS7T1W7_9FIRM|nr:hypothetical protein [Anaerococcus murdochii]MBZ2387770.1 hypothetical protein [Anaerococcus murdochii]